MERYGKCSYETKIKSKIGDRMIIRDSTILKMFEIINRKKMGIDVGYELIELLNHNDYKVQFDFYKNHPSGIAFTIEDFVQMFNNIENDVLSKDVSIALKHRRKYLESVFRNIEFYMEKYKTIQSITENDLNIAVSKTNLGLIKPINLQRVEFILAIGVGVTGGFNMGDINFLDYIQVIGSRSKQGILNTISHELHHKGFKEQFQIEYNEHRLVDNFIHFFAGEGLAIKFGNNFEGMMTSKLFNCEHTYIKESYNYYLENYQNILTNFKSDLFRIFSGEYSSLEMIENLFDEHYYFRDLEIDGILHKLYLKNPIAYYLGADIWGLIYDRVDISEFFELLQNPDGVYEKLLELLE